MTVFQLSPQPLPPARGAMAFKFDAVVFCLAGVGLLLLSFYVVDAIQLNSNFVRLFRREVTEWGRSVVDRSHRSPPLTEKELSTHHEIFFCHMAIRVVAPLIWYPLLVLTLLVAARSSVLDNCTWPPGLVFDHWHHCGMGLGERYVAQARKPSICAKLHSMIYGDFGC